MRFAALRERLPRALGVSPVDLTVAIALAMLGELDAWFGLWRGPRGVNALVVPVMAMSLAWRRRRPLVMLAIVMGGVVLLSLAFGGSETSTLVFITVVAVYSAAAHLSDRELPVAVALMVAAVAVHDLRDPQIQTFSDAIWTTILWTLTFLVGLGMRSRQAQTRALENEAGKLRQERETAAAEAAAEERRRIARELHDIISHSLGVVVLQAGAAEQVLERDPDRARDALKSIRSSGLAAIEQMGTLLGLVRGDPETSLEPQPSLADLNALVATTKAAGLRVDLSIEGTVRTLPAALELSAYRIVQEGLTNSLKHAGPVAAHVIVSYRPSELAVEVTDEGGSAADGFGSGRGLAGIRERVAVFGGQLQVGPRSNRGWTLRAAFPLDR
ncbi:MAG TPA: histidine kinase [Candidatus Dormibacteraeota bacterium]|nr:histidine kinase [Candidatus Dormibacteraeota bacterium]